MLQRYEFPYIFASSASVLTLDLHKKVLHNAAANTGNFLARNLQKNKTKIWGYGFAVDDLCIDT